MGNKKGRKIKAKNKRRRRLQQLQSLRQQRNDAVAEVSVSNSSASDMEVEPNEDRSNHRYILLLTGLIFCILNLNWSLRHIEKIARWEKMPDYV